MAEHPTSSTQRGLLIVISDFLDDSDCTKPLQYLADFGHELLLLQIWADEDRTPPWDGELDLEDAETGRQFTIDTSSRAFRAGFAERSRQRMATFTKLSRGAQADLIEAGTVAAVCGPAVTGFDAGRSAYSGARSP